jgi:hypothetical protein
MSISAYRTGNAACLPGWHNAVPHLIGCAITFDIGILEERGILRFTLRGPGTHAHLLHAVATIAGESASRGTWLVLCDASRVTPPPGAFERFEAGVELARAADPRMKLAVVARAEIVDYIFQNVARSRGASVAVFSSETAALRWLLGAKKGMAASPTNDPAS